MGGHMRHPPYASWHFAADLWWVAMFLCAAIAAARSNIQRRFVYTGVFTFLVVGRLVLGSAGGGFMILEIPAIIWLTIVSVRVLRHHRRVLRVQFSPHESA